MSEIAKEDVDRAARVLIQSGLRVAKDEELVLIGDLTTDEILGALERAGRDAGAAVSVLRLDQLLSYSTNHTGERPHKILPEEITRAMNRAKASVFAASALRGESSMREQLQRLVATRQVRHAYLPDITTSAFTVGLAVNLDIIAQAAATLEHRLGVAREITATSTDGTNLVIHPGARQWVSRIGRVEKSDSVVFPTGSLMVSPESARGTFAATASLGEFFGARERLLRDPVIFEIEEGFVRKVTASSKDLQRDIEAMLAVAPNSNRVGLVVLGLNEGPRDPVGLVCVDQHRPGLHLVFGDPQAKLTQAGWSARTSFAACQASGSVFVDGILVSEGGRIVKT